MTNHNVLEVPFADVTSTERRPPSPSRPLRPARIWRYWKSIAVIAMAFLVGTSAYIFLVPSQWEASAHVLVTPVPADVNVPGLGLVSGSLEPARSVQTAVALLDTPTAAATTAAKLGASWTEAAVQRSIVVEPLGQSYVVRVSGRAGSASEATRLVNAFAETALEIRDQEIRAKATTLLSLRGGLPADAATSASTSTTWARLELMVRTGDPSLSMAQSAIRPTAPAGLPPVYKLALAVLIGLCIGMACAWLRSIRAGHRVE